MNRKKKLFLMAVFLVIFGHSAYANGMVDMNIIRKIESNGNARAWNKKEDGRGLYQINPICLKEWNNYHPKEQYTADDLWNANINTKIAKWYLEVRIPQMLRYYGLEVNTRNIIIAYNAGIKAVIEGYVPTTTKKYLEKYEGGK